MVLNTLQGTLSSDKDVRLNAEMQMSQFTENAGFCNTLLKICDTRNGMNANFPESVITCAAVAVKNFIKYQWTGNGTAPLDQLEREKIRQNVLEVLFGNSSDKKVRDQLLSSLTLIAKTDFPEQWQNLATVLSEGLRGGISDSAKVSVISMDELFKRYRYEMKSEELWKEILYVLTICAEPITKFFVDTVKLVVESSEQKNHTPEQCREMFDCIFYCAEIFHSLNSQDLCEYFEDNLKVWMEAFLTLMKINMDFYPFVVSDEEDPYNKLRVALCEIFTLFSQRYEEEFLPYMQPCVELMWEKFFANSNVNNCDSLVNASMNFLGAICIRPQYKEMFTAEGVLVLLLRDIVIKNMVMSQDDIETFEDDPAEYLKKDLEGGDAHTKRRGAADLLKILSTDYPAQVSPIIQDLLKEFVGAFSANRKANWLQKEITYSMVTSMLVRGETARMGVTKLTDFVNLDDFYIQYVRPEIVESLPDELPIITCAALKFAFNFRHKLQPLALKELVSAPVVGRLLSSSNQIIHWYTGNMIDKLLNTKSQDNKLLFTTADVDTPALISSIAQILELKSTSITPYVIKALMRVLNFMDDSTAAGADNIINALAKLSFTALKQSANPVYIHYIFECMCVVIKKAYSRVAGGIDQAVLPVIEHIFTENMEDYVPYALQISALLISQCSAAIARGENVNSDAYHGFIQFVLTPQIWQHGTNVPAGVIALEAYIKAFPNQMFSEENVKKLFDIYNKLIGSKANDQHGFTLGNILLPYLNKYPTLTFQSLFIPIYSRLSRSKTFKLQKNMMIFVCRFVLIVGASEFVNCVNVIQNGLALMTMNRIFALELASIAQMTTSFERKILILGMAKIFQNEPQIISESFVPLLNGVVKLIGASIKGISNVNSQVEMDEELLFDEDNFNNKFCRLSVAKPEEDIFKEVKQYHRIFSDAIIKLQSSGVNFSPDCNESLELLKKYVQTTL
ncbi:Exportin-2 [Strongyloides ratti]|uniref:Exportin-2 n=1 Tax=Strongyloides ratti TaxID=34506 RepID=A0A090LM88_STRRB|nr:Exportin-2 [Strongyloides ratti]CEF68660.1 Exportin-2 [Strongyloides ratti]